MIEKMIVDEERGTSTSYREFKNIMEFYNFITKKDINELWRNEKRELCSETHTEGFTGTKSFEEALYLLKNGWKDMSEKIEKKVRFESKSSLNIARKKSVYDVVGYQASVPRYLNGIPTNMVMSKNVPVKQKVFVVNKCISYAWNIPKEKIIEESVKMISAINSIEQKGIRCKINILIGSRDNVGYRGGDYEIAKVCIKELGERINISKMSFLLVHPSVLRRLYMRYIEVSDTVKRGFRAYGAVISTSDDEVRNVCKGEYLLPSETKYDKDYIARYIDKFFVKKKVDK